MKTRLRALFSCLVVLLLISGAPSDDKKSDKNARPDKSVQVVEKVFASLAKAYNARDSKAVGNVFAATGEFIDAEDNEFEGREAIVHEFEALFEVNSKNKGAIKLTAENVREISPGVLSVDSEASFADANESDGTTVDFTAIVVKQSDGNWLLASIRSEGERSLRSPHARLKKLEWLIGDWIDESEESTMKTSTRWSEDAQFILTDFVIHVAGRKVMSGMQRIGWDGSIEKFRSWVFDSEGGHAEGIWTEIDDRWIVKSTGVRPDGDACSATNTYEPQGTDVYLFSVTNRIVGDETQPDFTARVVRKPPEPKTNSTKDATK